MLGTQSNIPHVGLSGKTFLTIIIRNDHFFNAYDAINEPEKCGFEGVVYDSQDFAEEPNQCWRGVG